MWRCSAGENLKRFLRILLKGATLLSLGLCVAVCVVWVRSHLVRDYAWVWAPWPADTRGQRYLKVDADSGGGQFEISWHLWTAAEREELRQGNERAEANTYHRTFPDPPRRYTRSIPPTPWNTLGFKWYSGPTHTSFCLPYWLVALLTGTAPVAWAAAWARRRRRVKQGLCPTCGYDLRATPGRCPECGTEAAALREENEVFP
jgi:hypothetical protein